MNKISVIGLGKLGLPLMAAVASRGFDVTGYDNDPKKIKNYKECRWLFEPGLEDLLAQNASRIQFTDKLERVLESGIIFVVLPTPSLPSGEFSIVFLEKLLIALAPHLKKTKNHPIISIVSTVLPGSMQKLMVQLEKQSGKKCGDDFGMCYNPAFIALGNVIHNFLHPDFVLIGESDAKTGLALEKFYMNFCKSDAKIHRMNFVNAELTKISVNTFVTMKISFGNMLARICERLPGAHSEIVTQAIGSDKRIGTAYLKGALGYGGPCFPRDNKAFSSVAKRLGLRAHSAEATDKINTEQVGWLAGLVLEQSRKTDKIAVLGLSYKPDTDVIEESQGISLCKLLRGKRQVLAYDPQAMPAAKNVLGKGVTFMKGLAECLTQADVIIITTPWKQFKDLRPEDLLCRNGHPKKIIDPWRILEQHGRLSAVEYIPLGLCLNNLSKEVKS